MATAVYLRYLRAGTGSVFWTVQVLAWAYLLNQIAQLVSQWWVTFWVKDPGYTSNPAGFYMGIFAALGLLAAFFAFLRVVVMALVGVAASRSLHHDMLSAVLRAPMAFFDTTPLGRVLARFSKDTDSVDQMLPQQIGMFWFCVFSIAGTLGAIIFATPWFALVCVPVLWIYMSVMTYFRNVMREVKRYDSVTRSPIYAHFSESLGGLSVFRAYALQGDFSERNEANVARNVAAWYTLKCCDRWLSVRLEILSQVVVLAAALLALGTAVGQTRADGTAAGLAGFSLSYAMAITGLMNWTVRTAAECEAQMNSVERLTHYSDGF